ncbi:hypothetical protein GLW03_12940 [Halobacillus halophilus]|uniref:hypothetical protein n=1 Tax=Halobacillus halophilus TaxID=1570 RepID=UPI00136F3FA7|nr:hypothetical protein [Halobacillus halophilus]MYL30732.1 hypothetical protein [Halobacillus halophilus]
MSEKSARELLQEGYGEEVEEKDVDTAKVEHGEKEYELSEEDKQLLKMEEDGETFNALLQMRLGFLKKQIEEANKDDDNGNPNA